MKRLCTNPKCKHIQETGRFCVKCGWETTPDIPNYKLIWNEKLKKNVAVYF